MALVIRNERKIGENASAGNRVTFLVHKLFLSVAILFRNLCANAQGGGKRSVSRPFVVRFQPTGQIVTGAPPLRAQIMAVAAASIAALCRFYRESFLSNRGRNRPKRQRRQRRPKLQRLRSQSITARHLRHNSADGGLVDGLVGEEGGHVFWANFFASFWRMEIISSSCVLALPMVHPSTVLSARWNINSILMLSKHPLANHAFTRPNLT